MTMTRLPSECAAGSLRFSASTISLALVRSASSSPMPSSSQMVSRNSVAVTRGFRMTATSACWGTRDRSDAHDRGLAGTHLARELNEAAGFVDAVQQVGEGLGVALAQVEIARVRCDREGLFDEAEKARVHGGCDDTKLSRGADPSRPGSAAGDSRE